MKAIVDNRRLLAFLAFLAFQAFLDWHDY